MGWSRSQGCLGHSSDWCSRLQSAGAGPRQGRGRSRRRRRERRACTAWGRRCAAVRGASPSLPDRTCPVRPWLPAPGWPGRAAARAAAEASCRWRRYSGPSGGGAAAVVRRLAMRLRMCGEQPGIKPTKSMQAGRQEQPAPPPATCARASEHEHRAAGTLAAVNSRSRAHWSSGGRANKQRAANPALARRTRLVLRRFREFDRL